MAREQTVRKHDGVKEAEEQTIPPIRARRNESPIAPAGAMADLDPAPPTPRPATEEEEIGLASARTPAPPSRPGWTGLWVALGAIAVLAILAFILAG